MVDNIVFLKPILVEKEWGNNDFSQFGFRKEESNLGEVILLSDNLSESNQIINFNINEDLRSYYFFNRKSFNSDTGSIPIEIKIINPKYDLMLNIAPDHELLTNYYHSKNQFPQHKFWLSLNKEQRVINCNYNLEFSDYVEDFVYSLDNNYLNSYEFKYLESFVIGQNVINQIRQENIIYQISFKDGYEIDLYEQYNRGIKQDLYDYLINNLSDSEKEIDLFFNEKEFDKYLVENDYYATKVIEHSGIKKYNFNKGIITHIFVIQGSGKVNMNSISNGANFIVKSNVDIEFIGELKMIITHIYQ